MDGIDRIPPTPPAWALRERDARKERDQQRPKPAPQPPADDADDDEPPHLIDVHA